MVEMGATVGTAGHGPVVTVGSVAAAFVGISGHDSLPGGYYSTNVRGAGAGYQDMGTGR
jgi:hypothetical protein